MGVEIEASGARCPKCGEIVFDLAEMNRQEEAAAHGLAARGIHSGVEFRFVRKVAGLRATDVAEMLDVRPETVSRWERGELAIPRLAAFTLAELLEHPKRVRQRLEALAHIAPSAPPTPPKTYDVANNIAASSSQPSSAKDVSATPRVEIKRTSSTFEIRMIQPKLVAKAIGKETLAAFYKCFIGVDRIATFEHLIVLNGEAEKQDAEGKRLGPEPYARNLTLLGLLLSGTMYELGEALQQLCATRVALKIRERAAWAQLDELRARWNKEPFASTIRNSFAHHLGELDAFIHGLESTPDDVVLYQSGRARISGRVHEPWNALLRANAIQDDAMESFIAKTQEGHSAIPDLIFALLGEVLSSNGIPIRDV